MKDYMALRTSKQSKANKKKEGKAFPRTTTNHHRHQQQHKISVKV